MIGRIQGCLLDKQAPEILIDVGGLGYELTVPMMTFYELPEVGQTVSLSTHFVVREDAQLLFGFQSRADRDLFRVLIKVSGIGPKAGLAILSAMTSAEVIRCIQDGNKSALVKVPGIGPKTAERLIIETRDKLKQTNSAVPDAPLPGPGEPVPGGVQSEAEAALESLGYKRAEAARAVAKALAASDGEQSVEQLIRAALRIV